MATKGLDRKAAAAGTEGKRMLILDQEKCKPMMPAHDFLKRIAKSCGRDCITMDQNKKIQILEDACLACLNRAKQCPGDAVKIIKLPSNLQTDVTHKCATPTPILPLRPAPLPIRTPALTLAVARTPPLTFTANPNPGQVRHEHLQAARPADAAARLGARPARQPADSGVPLVPQLASLACSGALSTDCAPSRGCGRPPHS
jgi:NAD-dependent dihydropyrimidine dehydrogenase PreA subunit